jgi:hypothetical protein
MDNARPVFLITEDRLIEVDSGPLQYTKIEFGRLRTVANCCIGVQKGHGRLQLRRGEWM